MHFTFNELSLFERLFHNINSSETACELKKLFDILKLNNCNICFNKSYLQAERDNGISLIVLIHQRIKRDDSKKLIFSLFDKFSYPVLNNNHPILNDNHPDNISSMIFEGANVEKSSLYDSVILKFLNSSDENMLSLSKTKYSKDQIKIDIKSNNGTYSHIELANFYNKDALIHFFKTVRGAINNWSDLFAAINADFTNISVLDEVKDNVNRYAFSTGKANSIYHLCSALNEMASAEKINIFNELYKKYCTGKHAMFSDSSTTDKRRFSKSLSFSIGGEKKLCPFHGKIRSEVWRLHIDELPAFTREPVIVYIGPKLTKH